MVKSGEDFKVRADMGNLWVNADFADIVAAQKWAIDYLCKGALLVEIIDPSGEVVETLRPDDGADSADQYDEGDIADLLSLE